ncbi:E3 ubiquitin-protein ligase TRIM39-like [Anolis sagrei]|uniref:E3 ubiquitin-protein ligase TRIM39-like n=1 Tax=Anolis sagrei TaxID=38937 RepID=UPI003520BBEC
MAAASPVRNLCEETTCPICLEYFKDPVIIDCGHIFCQKCITQCWNGPDTDTSCPQCREPCQQKNIRPIRQLASIVEIAKKFSLQILRGGEISEKVCERHQEPLKLFCEDDQILICVVCDKSKEHRQHKVIPKEEAFEEYKNKIWDHLKILEKERDDILTHKQSLETEMQKLLENIETERTKIVTEFKQLREFLDKKEQDLLTQLQDLDKEIQNISSEETARLSEEISSVETDIKKMEEKHNQPENELLQDIKGSLERCKKEKSEVPQTLFLHQRERIEHFGKIHDRMQTDINTFKATILPPSPEIPNAKQDSNICKDMKIPSLIVEHFPGNHVQNPVYGKSGFVFSPWLFQAPSADFKLSCFSYTMGFEKITSGCHSWEVEMENATFWAVGVAKESLRNSHDQSVQEGNWFQAVQGNLCDPLVKEGNWAICLYSENGTYNWTAFTSPKLSRGPYPFKNTKPLPVPYRNADLNKDRKKNISVILDYEKGSVLFKDELNIIYGFYNASFSGEPISSWVSVGK